MSITAVRIDGRLVHGQVANLWATKLNISRFMVVDDKMADNAIEKSSLKLAVPAGFKLSVLPAEKAAHNILSGRYDSQRLFVLTRRPDTMLKLIELGVPIKEINVGTMSQTEGSKTVTKQIYVHDDDIENFHKLNDKGVHLVAQLTPSYNQYEFMDLLSKVK